MNQELKEELEQLSGWNIPEHDVLEFLLDKLTSTPTTDPTIQRKPLVEVEFPGTTKPAYAWYVKIFNGEWYEASGSDPIDAAGLLLANLFKEGILTK